jgi:methyltransferase (TIGR00027 family)
MKRGLKPATTYLLDHSVTMSHEVDHPASQGEKRKTLSAAGIVVPSNVRYADIDFEVETLAAGLERIGVSLQCSTFFSWLGVTMYLTQDAIRSVLRTVVAFPSGSEVTFTFAQPQSSDNPAESALADQAAAVGEPWLSYFTPKELEATLRDLGFSKIIFLSRDEAMRRYYADRRDGLVPPRRISIVRAVV